MKFRQSSWAACFVVLLGAIPALAVSADLATPVAVAAPSTARLQTYQRFEEARAAGLWQQAITLGQKSVELAQSSAEADGVELTDLLLNLGESYARAGDSDSAIKTDERALALLTEKLAPNDPALVPPLDALADLQIADKRYADAESVLQRILAIERGAYGPRSANVVATLGKLQQLYLTAGRATEAAAVDQKIQSLSTTERALPAPSDADRGRRYKPTNGYATVRVFYGTNRRLSGNQSPSLYYGRERGDLQYGYLDVSIPQTHRQGELETQSRWSVLTYFMSPEAQKQHYVLLQSVKALNGGDFAKALRQQVSAAPSRDVFVFVHGFNSSFEDAARRTAQLTYDLDFDGTPMMYSWPSQASTAAYTVDEAAVGISGRKMADFLKTVLAQSGAQRIHLIAHSMGNRALMEALQTYLAESSPAQKSSKVFGQIVFTAPDVDRDYFKDAIPALRTIADRVTLYASSNDLALKTSEAIHGAPRAGLGGNSIIMLPGVDSIDMSEVEADMIGHNYYAANSGAIYDLFRILWRGDPPPQRCGMVDRTRGQSNFWLFNVSACKGVELLEAGVLVKRFGERARAQVRARILALTDPTEKKEWNGILTRLDELLNARPPR